MARRDFSTTSMLTYMLSRQPSTVQSCSLSRLYKAATAFGQDVLLHFLPCVTASLCSPPFVIFCLSLSVLTPVQSLNVPPISSIRPRVIIKQAQTSSSSVCLRDQTNKHSFSRYIIKQTLFSLFANCLQT
jgi:hypothetical protein